ncbi:hypothetical protein GCM10020220_089110 [Nonomuraea rubra]|uniref:hypothetical protein n=1 Tax=Nonomuraea rubra TaxID=46180 RepID=UPI0031E771A6
MRCGRSSAGTGVLNWCPRYAPASTYAIISACPVVPRLPCQVTVSVAAWAAELLASTDRKYPSRDLNQTARSTTSWSCCVTVVVVRAAGGALPDARVTPAGRAASWLGVSTASMRTLPSACGRTRSVRSAPEATSRSMAAASGTDSVTRETGSGSAGPATAGTDGAGARNKVVTTVSRTTADARKPCMYPSRKIPSGAH